MTDQPDHSPRSVPREASLVAAAGLGALVGTTADGGLGLLLAAAGGQAAVSATTLFWEAHSQRRLERASIPVGLAAAQLDRSLENFVENLAASPRVAELAAQAMTTAAQSSSDAKLRALGRCLANAVTDTATVDVEALIVSSLAYVDEPHIMLLGNLLSLTEKGGRPSQVPVRELAASASRFGKAFQPLLDALTLAGLVRVDDATDWSYDVGDTDVKQPTMRVCDITDFGREVIERLHEAS